VCGRTSLFAPRDDLEARFDAEVVADGGYTPRYNVAPGDDVAVVTGDSPDEIDRYRWGLVPPWADDPGQGIVNARSETAAETRAVADAWADRPCLVLSSGYYEWDRRTGRPYRVYREGGAPFAMAGLWSTWERGTETVRCATILTTAPNDVVAPIHDRMPVVVPADAESAWLSAGPTARADLCRPYPGDDLTADEISTRVNDPAHDDPSVIEPLAHAQAALDEFGSA
jgi:putative SOS response-associated peptidase YedK